MADLLPMIERLEAAAADCRAATREAHSATKELRLAIREADKVREAVKQGVTATVEPIMEAEVAAQIAKLGEATQAAMSRSVDKVIAEFATLTDLIFTGRKGRRGPDLRDELREYVERHGSTDDGAVGS